MVTMEPATGISKRNSKGGAMKRVRQRSKLRWWQVRTSDFALFLYAILFQRVLVLPIWIVLITQLDQQGVSLTYVQDLPIAGIHPTNMLSTILVLIWVYFLVCFISAVGERCYPWVKFSVIFLVIFGLLLLTTYNFNALFEASVFNMN